MGGVAAIACTTRAIHLKMPKGIPLERWSAIAKRYSLGEPPELMDKTTTEPLGHWQWLAPSPSNLGGRNPEK